MCCTGRRAFAAMHQPKSSILIVHQTRAVTATGWPKCSQDCACVPGESRQRQSSLVNGQKSLRSVLDAALPACSSFLECKCASTAVDPGRQEGNGFKLPWDRESL